MLGVASPNAAANREALNKNLGVVLPISEIPRSGFFDF